MRTRPRLGRGVRVRPDPRDATPVLLSPERGLRLSPTAAATVLLCDGSRDIDGIVDALQAGYRGADRSRIAADVVALLQALRSRGLVEGVETAEASAAVGPIGSAVESVERAEAAGGPELESAAPSGFAPYTLVAELTHRCPLACPYCSNPRVLVRRNEELSTNEWLRVIDDAADLGVMQIHLSGGEPLARPDLEAIAQRAHDRGLYVNLVTSGVPLDRARLERLAPSLDHLQVSIQAADPDTSDRIAGFASFDRKLIVAGWAKALGLPITLNVVLHRQNIDRIDDVIALAERLDVDRLELANVQLVSWALENRGALLPSASALERARRAASAARRRLEGKMQVVFVLPDWHADRPRACMDGWGRRFVIVAPDGAVLPCHAASALPLDFETVRSRPLATVWSAGEALNAYRGEAWMQDPCKTCDRRGIDFGGCRCQAFALTGDPRATDPACALAPQHMLVRLARADAERPAERGLVYRGRG